MAYKLFATDKINFNTLVSSQIFTKSGNNLVVTETFVTTLSPAQVQTLKDSYTTDKIVAETPDTVLATQIQSDLNSINQVYP